MIFQWIYYISDYKYLGGKYTKFFYSINKTISFLILSKE